MQTLDSSDIHHLRAAQGWYEFGNVTEALHELHNVSPEGREHPAALEMSFHVFAKQEQWDACRDFAESLTQQLPDSDAGWLHLAYATRRSTGGSVQAAFDILRSVADRFPKEPTFPYNLACYACQMGKPKLAWSLLEKAFDVGDPKQLKLMALDDRDLEPLWVDISEI